MSYCVNCGVELESGSLQCPLCDTPVINPAEIKNRAEPKAYSESIHVPKSSSKRFTVFVASIVLLIPNIVLRVLDLLVWNSGISTFVFAASALVWIWFFFPLLWKKPIPLIILQTDAISLVCFLYLFKLKGNATGWFEGVAMPIMIALWAVAALFIIWLKKERRKVSKAIAVTLALNVLSYVTEICVNMFLNGKFQIGVSLTVTACSIPLVIFFASLAKNRRLNAWVSRKFFM